MFKHRLTTITLAMALLAGAATITGCGPGSGRAAIPAGSEELASGKGNLTATATRTGKVWVLDETTNTLAWSGGVLRDQKIEVNASADKIIVAGSTVGEPRLDPDHRYVIYYEDENDKKN